APPLQARVLLRREQRWQGGEQGGGERCVVHGYCLRFGIGRLDEGAEGSLQFRRPGHRRQGGPAALPPCGTLRRSCITLAMPSRFATPPPVGWVDIDAAGVLNNAVYLSLIEQARFSYFEQLGLLPAGQVPFVLAEATVRFLRPGRYGMAVATAAAVVRLGNTSFTMEYEVRADAAVLATGTAVLVFV